MTTNSSVQGVTSGVVSPTDENTMASPSYGEDIYMDYYGNYTYEYDYQEALNHLPLNEFIPTVVFYSFVGLIGLVGNVLVIVAIVLFPRMRSITNVFLVNLASADLIFVLICVPVKGVTFFSYSWRLGVFLCKAYVYVQNVSMICSVMTLTVMSVERFMAILFPLRARYICTMRHARLVILCIWLQALVMAVPVVFGQKHTMVGSTRKAYWCRIDFAQPLHHQAYELYMLVIIFIIPVGVMAFTYTWICVEIWYVVSKRAVMRSGSECQYKEARSSTCTSYTMTSQRSSSNVYPTSGDSSRRSGDTTRRVPAKSTDDTRTRKQVIIMLIIVVLLFAVCWGPILINNVLVAFGVLDEFHTDYLKPMRLAFHLMSYANSCVNPIVYGFMSRNFRESFRKALSTCCKGKRKSVAILDMTRTSILKSSNGSDDKDNGFTASETAFRSPSKGSITIESKQMDRLG
ncbi:allatostatin-A receptor-like isoform X2 [Mizuhopecten yessoensis]|uniref:G-protein coupled receptor 54 n=1 Tax=Mizuhopecten yessoensis TaxID=6573 RepID=A0A210R5V7_MIZYE|nr:allatostatin-A receptor-like isoform X2 [Mizuhopecten yessoensis]OWF56335.1 G-protein coupled receptor 54 [Mizuhopecten yessoensis]